MFAWHFSQEMPGAVSSMIAGLMCGLLPAGNTRGCGDCVAAWMPGRLAAIAEALQPQRIADDDDRAGGHGDGSEHGPQDASRGELDEEQVVAKGPAEVLADDPAGRAGWA